MKALLLAVLLLTGVPVPPQAALRAVTFNIHSGIGVDARLDLARTADAIRATRADVVGLQEVDVHWSERSGFADQAAELARALGMRVFFAPIYDLPGTPRRRFGVAVLTRFPVLRAVNHEITRQSTQDSAIGPMPGFAEVVVLARGRPAHLWVTHLDFRPDPAIRARQVADMLAIVPDHGAHVLLGDLNAEPGAPELAPLWDRFTGVQPGPTHPADAPRLRLDHIAVSGFSVASAEVPASTASDHRPVVAVLTR
ncbi:endonuclease/exonuclease/phosphatase family protein [Actinokineospora soli]|uniref:Endonuclease/exonuclease/phosphatase family protein n=1 Tax=Actinokineospora soli TaxID=1048753 RepID=A0ABW2TJK6_9PSEU